MPFLLTASILALIRWQRQKPISLRGAVLVQDSDPRKQQPIAGVAISAGDLAASDAKSDSSGFFVLNLRKPIRKGHAIVLAFRHPQYRPLDLNDFVANKLYVVHLVPLSKQSRLRNQPEVKVANVRVRYTVKAMTELNVGSAVKTFEIENKGNVPCKRRASLLTRREMEGSRRFGYFGCRCGQSISQRSRLMHCRPLSLHKN